MAILYFLRGDAIESHDLPSDRPTRFDASGAILSVSNAPFAASIVPFSATPARFALVTGPSACVALAARYVCGVVELADRERLFVEDREFLLSYDALPVPVDVPRGATCPVCDRAQSPDLASRQRACPRCGARACESCWNGFRGGRCLTPHCQQPAALERELWSPAPVDFLDFGSAVQAAPVEA